MFLVQPPNVGLFLPDIALSKNRDADLAESCILTSTTTNDIFVLFYASRAKFDIVLVLRRNSPCETPGSCLEWP